MGRLTAAEFSKDASVVKEAANAQSQAVSFTSAIPQLDPAEF